MAQIYKTSTFVVFKLILLGLFGIGAGFASTRVVTNSKDSGPGSLRNAIANAASGDTIKFNLAYPATITLSSTLIISKNVTISGPGASNLAISGNQAVQVFSVSLGVTAVLSGLTIENGCFCTFPTQSNSDGGGIFNAGTLTLNNSAILGNFAYNAGGGIYNVGTIRLSNTLTASNRTISHNVAGNSGGGILNDGTLTMNHGVVSGNSSLGVGGGISSSGTLIINDSTVSNNNAFGIGGGINAGGTLTINNSTISGNQSPVEGGGIVNSGTLTMTNTTVSANGGTEGGGIYNFPGAKAVVSSSNISGNDSKTGEGGGIYNAGKFTVTNSTLSNNVADAGGAVFNAATLNVNNTTISANGAGVATNAGGIYNVGTLAVKNTIVANSLAFVSGGSAQNCFGTAGTSMGHNLSDDGSCYFGGTGDLNNTPAGLDPGGLRNNGGPTQTIALLAAGAGINVIPVSPINYCTMTDGITPIATDQRGVIRPQGDGCDIGAYEFATAASLIRTLERQITQSIPSGNAADKLELGQAATQLSAALAAQNWTGSDGNHINKNDAPRFFLEEGGAVLDLMLVLGDEQSEIPPAAVQSDLINLAFADRILATVVVSDAAGKNPTLLAQASAQISAGDQAMAAGSYNIAILAYAAAWTLAEIAF